MSELRVLLDRYINKPTDNPVTEHRNAGHDMSLMIHGDGFISWHQYFIAKMENWLVTNGGQKFVPLPYWNPAKSIPPQLNKNNTSPKISLPANLRSSAVKAIASYQVLNSRLLPYHADVHNNSGGQMPDPENSPSDPIFWPFHSYLVRIYEKWRNS
ncbi:MAG: tyrosinase family protein [Candidatus Nitrosotenuis sp.]